MYGESGIHAVEVKAEIDFVIVGGFAATLHGSSLVTRDLDVCASGRVITGPCICQ